MRVLIVEDEEILADTIAEGLRGEAIAVDVVYDGADALYRTSYIDYDVIVLDRDLPQVHGDDVCRQLVEKRTGSRILMLTAADEVDEKIDGLSIGADDYLGKPFVFAELVARIRALARRSAPPLPPVLERAGIRLDPRRRSVTREGRPVSLTKKEFTVLEELLRADGAVVSAEDLLDKAWDEHIDPFSNIVRVTMATLQEARRPAGDRDRDRRGVPVVKTLRGLRVSLRTRLTLIYGSLFLLTAVSLVAVTYFIARRAVEARFQVIIRGVPPEDVLGQVPGGEQTGIVKRTFIRQVEAQRDAILGQLLQGTAVTVVVLGLLAIVIGYVVAGRTLRPLQTVTATARRLSESTLHERIGLRGPRDEIKELADTFDGMLDRLHRAFDSQKRFIANASHELRTPLAINRTVLEVALAKPDTPEETKALGRKLLDTTARHERLIEGLLLLARSEREVSSRTPVDLAHLAGDTMDQLGDMAAAAGVTITRALGPGRTSGDVLLLERCMANLVENAIKYNVPDGRVWVLTGETNGWAYVRIENTGPPVPPDQTPVIFEPFRRLKGDRVGSARGAGLGLSIVRAVVLAHGGIIGAVARPAGGLAITLQLPEPADPGGGAGQPPARSKSSQ
jgi:DNA-binding response OmpR family regulator/signal transduction histidine kinase